jgi:hypothetical protein
MKRKREEAAGAAAKGLKDPMASALAAHGACACLTWGGAAERVPQSVQHTRRCFARCLSCEFSPRMQASSSCACLMTAAMMSSGA